ncbi:hypothetical protein K435DRAFT_158062 [Dendrothele bispora CBS 962.96]|uniref:Uncharacterized protein n=1 Tax=Dendrothele bispora (strain CBS 962.96) TaxID=1314807 RepID=A0A4S8LXR3_DENBC|nr:hypothetical protein K435DRAFT_158062 [Dendrothele bispora CBS 962.96]
MNAMIIDLPETASLYASGYFPGPSGYHPLHQHRHHGIHAFPPRLPGLSPIPPFPQTAGQGAAGFPFPPTHEELPLHMRFSNLHLEEHSMHGHARGPGGRGFPMPPPLPHGPPPIGPFGLQAFGHGQGIPMPPPGPPPFEFPPPAEFGAHGHPTLHSHVPGPLPARSDHGHFRSFGTRVRSAATVPQATTTATATADTPDTTSAETEATAASTAPTQTVRGDDTVPDPTLPSSEHHHRHGPHHLRGLHTHHGRGSFHRHHREHGRFGPHAHPAHINIHNSSRIPLLVNRRRALRFYHHHGLGFGRGRSFGYPYTGYPNPYYSFGLDDMEGGSGPTSDEAREGEEEKGREENARAGTEAEANQQDDEDPQNFTLDLNCPSPTLSEPSSESSWFTVSDEEVLEAPENRNERSTGIRATRTRNNDNHPAVEEEDYILLPPRSPSPSESDNTSSVDSESNESNSDTTFVPRGRPTPHAHSRHHHSHHHPHNRGHHDGPHHRPSHLGPWHHFDWTRARESALGGASGPGPVRGRGFGRGFGRVHPYFHDHPPPPPYHNGPDFYNDTHPDFGQLLGLGIPPHELFPPPSFPPTVDTNGEESLDFGPGFRFSFTRGRGGGGLGVRSGGGFRGRGGGYRGPQGH